MAISLKLLGEIMEDVKSVFGDRPVTAEEVLEELKLQIAGRA